MPSITHDDAIWTLDLGDDENRFSPTWLTAVEQGLDELEAGTGPAVLITIGSGKFYSNGLDLDWLGQHLDEYSHYVARVQALLARVLTLPVPTVAAVNGHAFGAGAMLALAHDYRVMRDDRGYVCFPEVDINIPFTAGMSALITAKLTPQTALAAMTTGRRYAGPQAHEDGLVEATAALDTLHSDAADFVRRLAGKDRNTLGAIKNTMFATVVDALRLPIG
jgi:enoyl-CoA hydratase/carnithine racemase